MPFLGVLLLRNFFLAPLSCRVWPWWCCFILMREAFGGTAVLLRPFVCYGVVPVHWVLSTAVC